MPHTNYKILLVEDAKVAQKMASLILKEIGCDVHTAETGQDAISKATQEKYDMIFMDLGLPDMDGFSVTEAIRKTELTAGQAPTHIIALTSHEGEHVEITCLDTKMNDFLVKPLTEEAAQYMLAKHLKKP